MAGNSPTLGELATSYLATLPAGSRLEAQQEITKFVRWCGNGHLVSEITSHEVNTYADGIGGPEPQRALDPVKALLSYARKQGLTSANLALAVKARKGKSQAGTRTAPEPIYLTQEGHQQKEDELARLKSERPRVADDIHHAMLDKDFRENAPLDAAKDYQGHLEARIRDLEATLKRAVVMSEDHCERKTRAKADLGSRVVLVDTHSGEEMRYMLVSPSEASFIKGKLSISSPVGKALLGHSPGEEFDVPAPAGTRRYRLECIEP